MRLPRDLKRSLRRPSKLPLRASRQVHHRQRWSSILAELVEERACVSGPVVHCRIPRRWGLSGEGPLGWSGYPRVQEVLVSALDEDLCGWLEDDGGDPIDELLSAWCACRCTRSVWHLLPDRWQQAIEATEAWAQGQASEERARQVAEAVRATQITPASDDDLEREAIRSAVGAAGGASWPATDPSDVASEVASALAYAGGHSDHDEDWEQVWDAHLAGLRERVRGLRWPLTTPTPEQLAVAPAALRLAWQRLPAPTRRELAVTEVLSAHDRAPRLGLDWADPVQRALAERATIETGVGAALGEHHDARELLGRLAALDYRGAVFCACQCVRLVSDVVPYRDELGDQRSELQEQGGGVDVLDVVEAWTHGEVSTEAVARWLGLVRAVAHGCSCDAVGNHDPAEHGSAALCASVEAVVDGRLDAGTLIDRVTFAAVGLDLRGSDPPLDPEEQTYRRRLSLVVCVQRWPLLVPTAEQLAAAPEAVRSAWDLVAGGTRIVHTVPELLSAHGRAERLGLDWADPVQRSLAERACEAEAQVQVLLEGRAP